MQACRIKTLRGGWFSYYNKRMIRKILSVVTLILVAIVVWQAWPEIIQAVNYLANTNLWFILLIIPEQLLMYYCVGQMFFSYLSAKNASDRAEREQRKSKAGKQGKMQDDQQKQDDSKKTAKGQRSTAQEALVAKEHKTSIKDKGRAVKTAAMEKVKGKKVAMAEASDKKVSAWNLARVSFELNFVNHAIPSGGVAGLGYISWRLKQFGSSVGQTSFMYLLRYAITIMANQVQVLIAIALICALGLVPEGAWWVIALALLISFGIVFALVVIVVIASSRKRIDWFVKVAVKTLDALVKFVTFGRHQHALEKAVVQKYFYDLHENLTIARQNKKILIRPILWGLLYSFLEVATYWLVASSMGHPEVILQFMVAEAIASAVGAVMLTPGGVGGYEGAMIFIVSALGVDIGLATAVVVSTRVIVLVGTIVSGYGFYQHAISKLGKKEKEEILKQNAEQQF